MPSLLLNGATGDHSAESPSFFVSGGGVADKTAIRKLYKGRGRVAATLKLAAEEEETLSPRPLGFFPQRNRRGVCTDSQKKENFLFLFSFAS